MTLDEIKTAVRAGLTVCWMTPTYEVHRHLLKSGAEQWLIACTVNGSCVGLTHADGVTLSEKPETFFLKV